MQTKVIYICVSRDYITDLGENLYVYTIIVTGVSRLDNVFLQHIDEINDNSLIRVLDPDINEDNELLSSCSSDKNTTEFVALNDNVVAVANVTGSGAPYCRDVNVVDSSILSACTRSGFL